MTVGVRHELVNHVTRQLLLASYVVVFLRFMRDRSLVLAALNVLILSVINLICQIINNQYEIEIVMNDSETEVVCNTVNKLLSNTQTFILLQCFYSIWYHYTFTFRHSEKIYSTIFLFLIEDDFPLNKWSTVTCSILDTGLLLLQLALINIQANRLPDSTSCHYSTILMFLTNNYNTLNTVSDQIQINDSARDTATSYGAILSAPESIGG